LCSLCESTEGQQDEQRHGNSTNLSTPVTTAHPLRPGDLAVAAIPLPRRDKHRGAMATAPRVLGQLLLAAGAIGAEQLAAALAEQRRTRERIGEVLVRAGADAEAVASALAAQQRLAYSPAPLTPAASALTLVDGPLAARLQVVPLSATERTI